MSSIPFVIDNQHHVLGDVLNTLLAQHQGQALDIATAYFNVGGWRIVYKGLQGLDAFRLLLGDEPEAGTDLGLREIAASPVKGLIHELQEATFNEETLRQVEDLTAFLRRENVQVRLYTRGFLHAKCYLFYRGGGFEHFHPIAAIVGSSNFTRAGLSSNKELNLVHRANLEASEIALELVKGLMGNEERQQLKTIGESERRLAANVPGVLAINELADWFERQWEDACDFKTELLDLINASKFGHKEYTPYQIYMKALFEYFRDDLDSENRNEQTRSAVELSEFQEDAVKKARKILSRYDGVMVADSVGLGKTWIGKKLLEDYAYHLRYKAVVVCPAALHKMWQQELASSSIAAHILTQESLGREDFDLDAVQDADVILVDESHNFRHRGTQRYDNLERLLAGTGRHGAKSHERKKLILLTATPINNSVYDLYHQVALFTGGDRSYFAAAGIGDLQRYFLAARRAQYQQESGVALYNLLEEIVIRRTRPFIKQAYPNATIKGQPIHWPERRLKTIRYNLEATYQGIYEKVVKSIEGLSLAPYRLETYKKRGVERNQFTEGREEALVGIFKSRYLKRFESSIEAFRISVRRALEFLETFESYVLAGIVLDSSNFQKAMRFITIGDEEDDVTPNSRADDLDASDEARQFIESLPILDAAQYDFKRLHRDLRKDVDALRAIWYAIAAITPTHDVKLTQLKGLLAGKLKGHKVLIFTSYKDTAHYLYRNLCALDEESARWRASAAEPTIRHMDSGTAIKERAHVIAHFAPLANNRIDIAGTRDEIDLLISTDVLSEGQNLQDCGTLINYDLHWNPTRMVQRAGRIDRIGTSFDTLWIMNMFPDDGLEQLLGLVESLSQKIENIDRSGLLDVSVLGETVHPQNFNTLRRIESEDEHVIEEQERFTELVSSEYLLQNLKGLLDNGMRQSLEALPDGIHSGLLRQGAKGVFFAFTAPDKWHMTTKERRRRQHYWRYIKLGENTGGKRIEDNRYLITDLIRCQSDTARFVPSSDETDIFDLQEEVIESILLSSIERVAVEEAPKLLDPIQKTIISTLHSYVNGPDFDRKEIIAAMQKLNVPLPRVYVKTLRKAFEVFKTDKQAHNLLSVIRSIESQAGIEKQPEGEKRSQLKREDLKLICFDYIWD